MHLLFFLLSLVFTIIILVISLIVAFSRKKGGDGATGNGQPEDEEKSFWQYLGLVDNSPNLIRAIVAGNEHTGPIIGYMSNVSGRVWDPKIGMMRDLSPDEDPYAGESAVKSFIRRTFGKRIYGIPFIRNVRPLTIDRVVKKATRDTPGGAELSSTLSASFVKRYGLYGEILRPTFHKDVDTKDGMRFSVVSYAVIKVYDPRPAFTIYVDSFLQTISEIISGFISSKVINLDWEKYKTAGDGGNKFTPQEIGELNKLLVPLGVEVTQFTMSDPQLNSSIQAVLEIRKTAEESAAARKLAGEGEKGYLTSVGEGEAAAIERIASAKAKRFEELVKLYKLNGATDAAAVAMANSMISAEFNADAISKLKGTYVAGGSGVQISIPGGNQ